MSRPKQDRRSSPREPRRLEHLPLNTASAARVARAARTRGGWMFIPQKTSSGTHKASPFQPPPPARCRASTHALIHHTRMRVLRPVCTHDRCTPHAQSGTWAHASFHGHQHLRSHTHQQDRTLGPWVTHTQGSHSQCPTLQLHSWLIFKAFAWLSSGKYVSSHTFWICYLQLGANFPLKDGTQERNREPREEMNHSLTGAGPSVLWCD